MALEILVHHVQGSTMMVRGPTTWSIQIAIYLTRGEWSYFSRSSTVRVLHITFRIWDSKAEMGYKTKKGGTKKDSRANKFVDKIRNLWTKDQEAVQRLLGSKVFWISFEILFMHPKVEKSFEHPSYGYSLPADDSFFADIEPDMKGKFCCEIFDDQIPVCYTPHCYDP